MLNKQKIGELIEEKNLVESYIDKDKQLTPNGFDLTAGKIFEFRGQGALDFSNKERVIPEGKELLPQKINPQDKFGWWDLNQGSYKVRTNELVNLPNNLIALAFSRTSLLRAGALTQHGVWDAGFRGRGEFILTVQNPQGLKIKQNARVVQLTFWGIETTEAYQGIYKDLK
jgi:dUTP pyrophosphatase